MATKKSASKSTHPSPALVASAKELAGLIASTPSKAKQHVIQVRMDGADWADLEKLVEASGARSPAEVIRHLIRKAAGR